MQLAKLTQASIAGRRRLRLLGPQVLSGAVVVGHWRRGRASPGVAVCVTVEEAELKRIHFACLLLPELGSLGSAGTCDSCYWVKATMDQL